MESNQTAAAQEAARQVLRSWRRRSDSVASDRDYSVMRGIDAGLTKEEVHVLSGLSRGTVDRIVAAKQKKEAGS